MDHKEKFKNLLYTKIKEYCPNVFKVLEVFNHEFSPENVDLDCSEIMDTFTTMTLETLNNYADDLGSSSYYTKDVPADTFLYDLFYTGTHHEESFVEFFKEVFEKYLLTCSYSIIVKFNKVKISNEKGQSRTLLDLFVETTINHKGEFIGIQLIRSTFTQNEWNKGYIHSHVSTFYDKPEWKNPCLGTGPLRSTTLSLSVGFDINLWSLYVYELSKYVTVESLAGGPYIRMESLNGEGEINFNKFNISSSPSKVVTEDFIKYYLKNFDLKIAYKNGGYILGEPINSAILKLSKHFIEYTTKNFTDMKISNWYSNDLFKTVYSNGAFHEISNRVKPIISETTPLLTFKGKPVYLKILENNQDSRFCTTYILNNTRLKYILYKILYLINISYGNIGRKITVSTEGETENTVKTRRVFL